MYRFQANRRLICCVNALLCAGISALSGGALLAQTSAGRIVGAITDQSGGVIAGASVTVTDTERNIARKLTTDAAGAYNAPNLIPGVYSVRAESKGFSATERNGITLEVDAELQVDLVLHTGEQNQTVTISGDIPLIDTTTATLGGTLENKEINELPLNGRNFQNLLDLRPGVTKYPGGSNNSQSSDGGRPHGEMFLVEGVYGNDPWNAKSSMNATMAAGDAGTILPIEAIDQFKNVVNPQAEFGWKPGSVTVVGLKSGTNAYHGSAYAYGRDGSWDAQNFFSSGQPKANLGVEQWGLSLGAPIMKDKLFYFVNFEQQQYSVETPVQHVVPITTPGVGNASNNLVAACQAALASSTGLAALSAQLAGLSTGCVPLANSPGLFPVNNGPTTALYTALPSTNTINSGVAKVDYHLGNKNTLSGTYFISPGNGQFVDNPTIEISPNRTLLQSAQAQLASVAWTYTPTSTVVNLAHIGYSRYNQTFYSADHTQDPANYNGQYHIYTGQTNPVNFGFPLITIQGGFTGPLSGTNFPNIQGPDGVLYYSDNVSWQRGKHSLMFGVQIQASTADINVPGNAKTSERFANLTAFFQGTLNQAKASAGNYARSYSNQGYAGFAQDEWHVRPNVTVSFGVRYEVNTVVKEANNLLGNFDPKLGFLQVGKQISAPYNGDHNNFAPRLGIAWSVNSKTVVRVGGGIAFDNGSLDSLMSFSNQFGLNSMPTNVPFYSNGSQTAQYAGGTISAAALTVTGGSLAPVNAAWRNNGPNTPLFSITPACGDGSVTLPNGVTPSQCSIMGVDRNLRTPYVTNWMLDVQRSLGPGLTLDVAFVGNHGTKLYGVTDLNQPTPGAGWTPTVLATCEANPTAGNCAPNSNAIQAARPYNSQYPYLKYINYMSNTNESNYDGLQVSLTQRSWHGLSYVAGYTYSHAMGMSSDSWKFIIPINSANPKALYGNTLFDIRHRLTLSTSYAIPGRKSPAQLLQGWTVNMITHIQGGTPWGVNDETTDFSGTAENVNSSQTVGESWNFFGNASDFKTTKALLNTNNGSGGIPYFAGASNANCAAKAATFGPAAVAALKVLGCYASGSSMLIPPGYGTYGTLGPNVFRGPGFVDFDFSLAKTFSLREKFRFQFRAEVFNLFNHPILANPYGVPTIGNSNTDPSGNAGVNFGVLRATPDVAAGNPVLGAGGPRAIQLGLKILF